MTEDHNLSKKSNIDSDGVIIQSKHKILESVQKSEDNLQEKENISSEIKNDISYMVNSTLNNNLDGDKKEQNEKDNSCTDKSDSNSDKNISDVINDIHSNNNDCDNKNETDHCSDSESETMFDKITKTNDLQSKKESSALKKDVQNRLLRIIDSDSEDENISVPKPRSRRFSLNESEEDSDSAQNNKQDSNINNDKLDKDNDSPNISDNSDSEGAVIINKTSKFRSLIDSDSDDEEEENEHEKPHPIKSGKTAKTQKEDGPKSEKRKVSLRASKEEAMKQIQSETQRLIRESEVSLPYHNPKQRTLQEFLNRKKVITALPKAPTMAAKLKMSSAIVNEVLKEKEKEAEAFYKSSDSEEEVNDAATENTNTQCMHSPKKDNVSRKLFSAENFNTLERDFDDNVTSTKQNASDGLNEVRDKTNNEMPENNLKEDYASESMLIESYIQSDEEGNKKETSNIVPDTGDTVTLVQKDNEVQVNDISRKDDIMKNIFNRQRNHNSEILEDIPDATPRVSNDYKTMVRRSLGLTEVDTDKYDDYGLPPPKCDNSQPVKDKKTLLNITNIKPKLHGTPGTMIDLSEDTKSRKADVNTLIDRFMLKHSTTSKPVTDNSQVTVTHVKESPNGLSIVKETLPYRKTAVKDEDAKLMKPGAKLQRLKEELKHKMAQKRDEEWKQKEQEMKEQEIEWNESINEEDKEPFSPDIESNRSEEEELEEDDVCDRRKKKKRRKNDFIDDEAEVSEEEIDECDEIEDEDEAEKAMDVEEESDRLELDEEEDEEENSVPDSNVASESKDFSQIEKQWDDDSLSSNAMDIQNNGNGQMNDNASDIPLSQEYIRSHSREQKSQNVQGENTFNFISPATQLTALNPDIEEEKEQGDGQKSSFIDSMFLNNTQSDELSQEISDSKKEANSYNKLCMDQENVGDDELMNIVSGNFHQIKAKIKFSTEAKVSESQLLDLCSGTFSTPSHSEKGMDFLNGVPQSTQLSSTKDSVDLQKDEQELKTRNTSCNLRLVSSDEEDSMEEEAKKRSKRKVTKLDLSDDETDEDNSVEGSDDEENEDDDEKYVDYDSEENEVVVSKKNIKSYAATFLENEAELSESDCDVSADEDEKDMDKLEYEDMDDEEIDQEQVKDEVGKLHIRQLLDEDQKEVRMLKELLFEDGDLYTESGRERKFKWKNIDKQDDNNHVQSFEEKDGWVDLSEDEDEAKWRKIRSEREKFLAEKAVNGDSDVENDLSSSEVFKFGLKILKKRRIDDSEKQNTLVEPLSSKIESRIPRTIAEMLNNSKLDGKSCAMHNVMQKRSFLARSKESLARLAALARQKEAPLPTNKRNFVFAHIDITEEKSAVIETESTPSTTKKHR